MHDRERMRGERPVGGSLAVGEKMGGRRVSICGKARRGRPHCMALAAGTQLLSLAPAHPLRCPVRRKSVQP